MVNPWEEISLSDYENHMKLDSVMQLQNMNQMMKGQFNGYPVSSVMIVFKRRLNKYSLNMFHALFRSM